MSNFVLDLHNCEMCQRFWEGDLEVLAEVETAHVKQHVLEEHPELQVVHDVGEEPEG